MVNPLGRRNADAAELLGERREARAPPPPWARPALRELQAAPRCKALRVLTALPGARGAPCDCRALDRLLGSPRVPGGCFEVVLLAGARRARRRVDVPAESVLGLSCGRDHVLLHASRRGAGSPDAARRVLLGLGNSWSKQVRQEWEAKPPGCLITFSGPAESDFEFPWLDVFVDPLVVKRSPIDSPKGVGAAAASPPRPEQQPRREPRPAADLEHGAVTAFSATGGPHSCVAFGCTARWGRRTLVLPKPVTLVAAGTSHCVFLCSDRRAFGYGEHVTQGQLGYYVAPQPLLGPRRGRSAEAKQGPTSPQKQHAPLSAQPAPSQQQPPPQHHPPQQQQRGGPLQVEIPEVPDEFRLPRHPVLLAVGVTTLAAAFETTLLCAGPKVWSPCGAFEHFFDEPVEQLVCGRAHAVALLSESRRVMAWGSNERGAVGVSRPHHPIGGHYHEPQLVNGRLGPLWPKEQVVADVAAGEHYSMLRTRAGDVYVWGSLCRGDIVLRPQLVQLGGDRKASAIAAGPTYCVLVGESSSNGEAPTRSRPTRESPDPQPGEHATRPS
jgi:hypothetical protein